MAAWPTGLPGPQAGYTITEGSNALGRKTQSGRPETRRFGSGAAAQGAFPFKFTAAQKVVFDAFFRVDLSLGINWFSAPWLADLGYPNHKAKIAGYVPVKGAPPGRTEYTITLHIKKTSACPATDVTWPPASL